jgi:hypothetical protein
LYLYNNSLIEYNEKCEHRSRREADQAEVVDDFLAIFFAFFAFFALTAPGAGEP